MSDQRLKLYTSCPRHQLTAGRFPKRIRIGPGRIGWVFREFLDWMQSEVDARPVGPMSPKVIIDTADRFVHTKELRAMVLYSRNHVRNLEPAGKFPRHIWLSDTRVVWLEREVKEWLQTQRGAAAAALKTYHSRLCRPRFEVTSLSVRADSSNSAEPSALTLANTSTTRWRLLPYQPEIYEPHVAIFLQSESPKESTYWQEILGRYHDNNRTDPNSKSDPRNLLSH